MRVGNFSLYIPEGRERDSGHVEIQHNTVFSIRVGNHLYDRRCDAEVEVDGKNVGTFRIDRGSTIYLQRGAEDTGRFTFFAVDSAEAQQAGQSAISRDDRGLIRVTFRSERTPVIKSVLDHIKGVQLSPEPMHLCSAGRAQPRGLDTFSTGGSVQPQNCGAGITGLTGHSGQRFHEVPNLDYDPDGTVVITLRLVVNHEPAARPVVPVAKGNPTPAPL